MLVQFSNLSKEYTQKHTEIAELEAKIYKLSELLSVQRSSTIENVQRKQARTGDEREEDEDEVVNDEESEDEDEGVIYNPKNLPLGWDGKVFFYIGLFLLYIFI
jgi:splicing factor 3A subunit 3